MPPLMRKSDKPLDRRELFARWDEERALRDLEAVQNDLNDKVAELSAEVADLTHVIREGREEAEKHVKMLADVVTNLIEALGRRSDAAVGQEE